MLGKGTHPDVFCLHDETRDAYVAIGIIGTDGKWQQSYRHLSELSGFRYDVRTSVYISQSEFAIRSKKAKHVKYITVAFCDIDKHLKKGEKPLDAIARQAMIEALVSKVLEVCRQSGIPLPSIIMDSGQGIHVKWYFIAPLDAYQVDKWNVLQRNIRAALGGDPAASDVSRVLRLEGTLNSKSGTYAKIIFRSEDDQGQICRYSFEELCHAVPEKVQPCQTVTPSSTSENGRPSPHAQRSELDNRAIVKLQNDRINDLRRLAKIRGWDINGIPEPNRDKWMFVALCLHALSSPEKLLANPVEMAKEFAGNLPDDLILDYASSLLQRVRVSIANRKLPGPYVDTRYKLSTEYIIDMLGITPREQRQLKTLNTKEEREAKWAAVKEQHRARNRRTPDKTRTRKKYLADLAKEHKQKELEIKKVIEFYKVRNLRITIARIAAEVNLSRETVSRNYGYLFHKKL